MNFLYPSFLFAIGLVAIPIIIHLFNFQRAKKVYFTNIEFLKEVKAVSNSRNRLKNLLVLLMRCLFITALAMAFAQPFIPNKSAPAAARSNYVSLYIDNSFSMQNEADNKRLFDVAISYGEQIVRVFPANAMFQLLNNNFEGALNYFFEAGKISDNLQKMDYSNTGRAFENVYDRQLNAFKANSSASGNHVFWISDFQKYSSGDLSKLKLDSANMFYLMPLHSEQTSNLYVDSLWLENPFVKVNENNTVNVKINHFGSESVSDRIVKLFIGENQVSSGTVSIDAGGSQTLKLNFAVNEGGEKHCRIEIDDVPVLFDNDYYFTLKVAPTIRIVHISADNSNYVPGVYSNEPFFEVEKFSINAVDYNKLGTANLIVLQSLPDIDNALETALRTFIGKGGTVAVFPAANADPQSYTSTFGASVRKPLSPERLALNTPDAQNPFFTGVFERISANMAMPSAQPALEWSGGQTLLHLKNNLPFLGIFSSNRNSKVFLFSAPLDPKFSDFATHALFVPVMYKIALSSRKQGERPGYSFNESVAAIEVEEVNKNDIFKLVPAGSTAASDTSARRFELIPSQRIAEGKLIIDIPKTGLSAGNYNLVHSSTNKPVAAVAFNYDRHESVFDCYSAEELRGLFANRKNVQVFEAVDAERFANEFKSRSIARPLWRYLLLAALGFLLIEVLIIRFWKTV